MLGVSGGTEGERERGEGEGRGNVGDLPVMVGGYGTVVAEIAF